MEKSLLTAFSFLYGYGYSLYSITMKIIDDQLFSNTGAIFFTFPFTFVGHELPSFNNTDNVSRFFFTLYIIKYITLLF